MTKHELVKKVLSMVEERLNSEEYQKQYKIPDLIPGQEVSGKRHRIIVGEAQNIAAKILVGGGTEEELNRALLYLAVCMDAKKYRLDYTWCAEQQGIMRLKSKYGDVKIE